MDDAAITAEYQTRSADCTRLLREVTHQLGHLLDRAGVTLGTPLEGRVKALASILEKQERKAAALRSITDFSDLIGARITLLFHRDLATIDQLLKETFEVMERTDNAEKLGATQFGYQSLHYILKLKPEWLGLPTFAGLGGYVFELQLRTLAQHIWAVTSHKLQYKREASVPQPVRRSISRVSALLELIDLELDRILLEREQYVSEQKVNEPDANDSVLNVDLLAAVMDMLLPKENKDEDGEPYDELLDELTELGVTTVGSLVELIHDTRHRVEADEAKRAVEDPMDDPDHDWDRTLDRYRRGVFFTHAGLLRMAMDAKFGSDKVRQLRKWAVPPPS